MSTIVGIDPGTEQSAFCLLIDGKPKEFATLGNTEMAGVLRDFCRHDKPHIAIEWIQSYGMPVGAEIFETCYWVGRFTEVCGRTRVPRITRGVVKLHLCHDSRAKDSNIRAALIERFGPGKSKAIGLKKTPGPLYRMKGDEWAALAVAVTYYDTEMAGKVTGCKSS